MTSCDLLAPAGGVCAVILLVILARLVSDDNKEMRYFWHVIFPVCMGLIVLASIWLVTVVDGLK